MLYWNGAYLLGSSVSIGMIWRRTDGFILGAYYQDLPPDVLGIVGCDDNAVMIMAVVEKTPAAKLGLRPGDQIVYIDGEPIRSAAFLDRKLVEKAGQEVDLRVVRTAGNFAGKVKLLQGRPLDPATKRKPPQWPVLGVELVESKTTAAEREKFGLGDSKVYVAGIRLQTPACLANLNSGDIILEVDGKTVNRASDLRNAVANLKSDKAVPKLLRGTVKAETWLMGMGSFVSTRNLTPETIVEPG